MLAVVLTGMGSDGLAGSRLIRNQGGVVLAQNQATSTVWGMPGAVAQAGLAHKILPLDAIAPEILQNRWTRPPCRDANSRENGGLTMETAATADYGYLRELVYSLSQNVLDPSRDYLFETRLSRVLRNQGMSRVDELVRQPPHF